MAKVLLYRNSRIIKLTPTLICSFKTDNDYSQPPTAVIHIKNIVKVNSFDEKQYFGIVNSFLKQVITTNQNEEFRFKSRSENDRDEWYRLISNALLTVEKTKIKLVNESRVFSQVP